jgi:hypothetical protein
MIVFVSDKKVSLRPVVEGKPKPTVTYAVNATESEKAQSINSAVTSSGMGENLKKTSIRKAPGIWGRYSLAVGGFYLKPMDSGNIDTSFGLEAHFLYRFINLWIIHLGGAAYLNGTSQKHTRADGDPDFVFRHFSAMGGVAIIVPLPFYRSLEFHFDALAGGTYSSLEKYKYVDSTLNFSSFNPTASGQTEIRWHFWRGLFVGVAGSYQRVFYPGADMDFFTASMRAGYRF